MSEKQEISFRPVTRDDAYRIKSWLDIDEVSDHWFGRYSYGDPAHLGYHPEKRCYMPQESAGIEGLISGTEMRNILRNGGTLPDWFMRKSVQELLRSDIQSDTPVFHC